MLFIVPFSVSHVTIIKSSSPEEQWNKSVWLQSSLHNPSSGLGVLSCVGKREENWEKMQCSQWSSVFALLPELFEATRWLIQPWFQRFVDKICDKFVSGWWLKLAICTWFLQKGIRNTTSIYTLPCSSTNPANLNTVACKWEGSFRSYSYTVSGVWAQNSFVPQLFGKKPVLGSGV